MIWCRKGETTVHGLPGPGPVAVRVNMESMFVVNSPDSFLRLRNPLMDR